MMAAPSERRAVRFTYCRNFASAETRDVEWSSFVRTASASQEYETKEQSVKRAAIVGGVREDESAGRADNVASRTILTLDYDDFPQGTSLDDVEMALRIGLDCAFVAYTTFRHTPDAPRVRVMAPLARTVSASEYPRLVDAVAKIIGLDGMDPCSKVVNQLMFLASHQQGVAPWSIGVDGPDLDVDSLIGRQGEIVQAVADAPEADDLAIAVASQPLDLTADQVNMLLESYPAEPLDYDGWLRVGMALYHQTRGEGYRLWFDWSKQSPKHDARQMRAKWHSFGGRENPVTMASLIKEVGGLKSEIVARAAEQITLTLEEEAENISDRRSYNAFKARVVALNDVQLPPDIRSGLAGIAHEVYAKDAKMGLREVKAAFKHTPARRRDDDDGDESADTPSWLEGWVYNESECLFVNTNVPDYAIKREAFRAKFDRMPEPAMWETDAADFALNKVRIKTVMNSMFWPGQPRFFDYLGAERLNSYHVDGAAPCDIMDDDGQSVVKLFLDHVSNTIEDPDEQAILLDFMSYVYRNPGKRVQWGLLLWGIEGNGKTFFYDIMQRLLGKNAKSISTSVIESQFTDWAAGAIMVGIEEIRIAGTNKWKILDQIKPMITNDTISVHPKGKPAITVPNFTSYMMTTNHMDAVPISDNDRRFCAIFTRHRRKQDLFDQHGGEEGAAQYFRTLFSECARRIDAIARFLMDRPISDTFEPAGRAPVTEGAKMMREANLSDERIMVEEAIADHACSIVNESFVDVTYLAECVMMGDTDDILPKGRALANIMRELGYQPLSTRRVKTADRRSHYVWVSSAYMEQDARAAVQQFSPAKGAIKDDFSDVPF